MTSMKGKVAVITGGAGMIGHAAAMSLAQAGADVMLVDINAEALGRTPRRHRGARRARRNARGRCSASRPMCRRTWPGRAEVRPHRWLFQQRRHGRQARPDHEYEEAEFDRIVAVNQKGIFLGLRHVLPVMLKQGHGAVVNTGSIASERGLAGACAYNASKHARHRPDTYGRQRSRRARACASTR